MRTFARRLIALVLLPCVFGAARGAPGQPDPGFGVGGSAVAAFDLQAPNEDLGQILAVDKVGRVFLVGTASAPPDDTCLGIARFDADGTPDAGFGIGGLQCHDVLPAGFELFPTDAVALADGRLLVAGVDETSGRPAVCGFTVTGEPDFVGFGEPHTPGCLRYDSVSVAASLPIGAPDALAFVAIAVSGNRVHLAIQASHEAPSRIRVRLARSTLAGVRVPFALQQDTVAVLPPDNATPSLWLSDLVVDAKGRLLLTGAVTTPGDFDNDAYVARLDANSGALDPSFGDGGLRRIGVDAGSSGNDVPSTLVTLPSGRMLVAGAADTATGLRPFATVLDEHGKPVTGFNGGKPAVYDPCVFFFGECRVLVTGAGVLPNDRALLAGYALQGTMQRIFTLRIGGDGTPDASYGNALPGQTGFVFLSNAPVQRARSLRMVGKTPLLGGWRTAPAPGARDFFVTRLQP